MVRFINVALRHFPALGLAMGLSGCVNRSTEGEGWVRLFNGRDLAGWTVKCQPGDQGKAFWTVDKGAIVCNSVGRKDHNYVWLMADGEYDDFELRLKFQVERGCPGNSGVQFRSRYDAGEKGGWLDGPQVDIHAPADMAWRTGLIYDETREERRWVFPSLKDARMDPALKPAHFNFIYSDEGGGWNALTLVCRGMRIKTIVNGITRTDWDASSVLDNPPHVRHNVGRSGHIALQLHSGDELQMRFKDIELRRLRN